MGRCGVIELEFDFSEFDNLIENMMTGMVEGMELFGELSKEFVPRDTGNLQDSFKVFTYTEGSDFTVEGRWRGYAHRPNSPLSEGGKFNYGYYQYLNHASKSYWIKKTWKKHGDSITKVIGKMIEL